MNKDLLMKIIKTTIILHNITVEECIASNEHEFDEIYEDNNTILWERIQIDIENEVHNEELQLFEKELQLKKLRSYGQIIIDKDIHNEQEYANNISPNLHVVHKRFQKLNDVDENLHLHSAITKELSKST